MKVNLAGKKARGRPKGSRNKDRRNNSHLSTNTATAPKIEDDNASSVVICSDSSSSHEKSLVEVVLLSDTITTDISDSSSTIKKKIFDARSVNIKEARVVLENILHSKLISPEQRTELLNRSYSSHSVRRSVAKKKKQRKNKSKAISISSATSGSSIVFLGNSTPKVTDDRFNPTLTLKKIKVEPQEKTSKIKTHKARRLSDKKLEKQFLNEKPPHIRIKLETEFSNASNPFTDRPVSIHSSSSSAQSKSIKLEKESRGTKRKRSETSFEGKRSLDGSPKKRRSRVKKSVKRRKKDNSKVKEKFVDSFNNENGSNKGSKKGTPKKNDFPRTPIKNVSGLLQTEITPPAPNITVDIQHIEHFCSFDINSLGNGNHADEPPILSPKNVRIMPLLVCHNQGQIEFRENDCSPLAGCISTTEVEIRPDNKLPQTSFVPSETEVELDLDEKDCSIDSIGRAIDNDLAAGNRLSPLEDIENVAADLVTDTCVRKMIISGSTTVDNPKNLQQNNEKPRKVSGRSSDSHETSSNISSSTAVSESDRKRKGPAIVKDDILPKGTISVLTNGKKKKRMASASEVSETIPTTQKINPNLSMNGNNAEYIVTDQSVLNLPSSLQTWSKCSEIEPLVQENTANDRLNDKHGCIVDDALNNNQELNYANKNTLNSEKQEEKKTSYSSPSAVPLDFEEEFTALRGLLTLTSPNYPNPITEVDGCSELDNSHPNSLAVVDDCHALTNNVPSLITTELDKNLELENDDQEVDEAIESFTASVNSSQMKNIRKKENGNQVASLTVENVDKFDCAASGSVTATHISSPTRSYGTESSRGWQLEDLPDGDSSSTIVRRRRWTSIEDPKSSPAPRGKLRLNRGNWSTERKEQSEFSSAMGNSSAQQKQYLVKSENAARESNKNENKFQHFQSIVTTATNNYFRKPSSPAKFVQKQDETVRKTVLGFGEGAIDGVPESDSETDENSGDSSGSSSSNSSSNSSSSSSSSSDSDSSDDEDATKKIVEKDTEKIPKEATGKVNESFFQKFSTTLTNNDPRIVPNRAEQPKNMGAPDSSMKYGGRQTTKEYKAQRVLEKVKENEKVAGSLIDDDLSEAKKDEDQDDCISLFADSTCMSRCETPPLNEPPKRKRSPLYQRMKSSNIDSFASANKKQCDDDIAAYKERMDNDNKDDEKQQQYKNDKKTVNEPKPNQNSMPILDPRIEIQIRRTVQVENKPDLRSTLNGRCEQEPKYFFLGECYVWLRFGQCNQSACRFMHVLKPQLQRISSYQMKIIEAIVDYAIANRYCFFLGIVHNQVVLTMSTEQIINLYRHLYMNQLLTDMAIDSTTQALIQRGMSLKEIVMTLSEIIVSSDQKTPNGIIQAVLRRITEPGTLWETLKKVISKILPPVELIEKLIEECINENKSKEHLHDVYENLIKGLPSSFLPNIRDDLLKRFHDDLNKSVSLNANVVSIVEPQHKSQEHSEIAESIASPDPPETSIPEQLAAVEKLRSVLTSTPRIKKFKIAPGSTSQRSSTASQTSDYSLEPIDDLPPPKSPYRDVLWKFHWDLQGVQEGLKHRDYTHVITILSQNMQHPSRLPHMEGFYNILCNEIMSSKHHLAEIVRLTVQSGASNDLRQFVFDLGVHVLTKLADIGAWVLAHELLKTFQVYGTYNTCAYTLLAVEIYIANYRPLKALELLKQSQLIFTNAKVWNQLRCPNDEPLRVTVMELLLGSLCDGHSQHALSLLEFILGDQCSNFKPINVSRYVDKIARALLAEKHTSSIIDFGRVVIQAHLSPSRSTLRALINSIFHNDIILARQLHRYATWLGAYTTAKISRTTHMVINNDWTEEEMFLMFSSLIKDLSTNIGHAIGRLRPRQLAVFLILETIPTEKHLYFDICHGPTTNAAINKRKAIVRNVLEHFDPKIRLVQRSQGRLCKLQSTSLVDYLKAGHIEY